VAGDVPGEHTRADDAEDAQRWRHPGEAVV
jgi:hypothetical protein